METLAATTGEESVTVKMCERLASTRFSAKRHRAAAWLRLYYKHLGPSADSLTAGT